MGYYNQQVQSKSIGSSCKSANLEENHLHSTKDTPLKLFWAGNDLKWKISEKIELIFFVEKFLRPK